MRRKASALVVVPAWAVLILSSSWTTAGDQGKIQALAGVWQLQGGEMKIDFADKGVMKLYPHGDSDVITIVCGIKADKGKPVTAKISGFEGTPEAVKKVRKHLPVGLEFTFKWQAKGEAATLSDVGGEKTPAVLRSHLEGEYAQKK